MIKHTNQWRGLSSRYGSSEMTVWSYWTPGIWNWKSDPSGTLMLMVQVLNFNQVHQDTHLSGPHWACIFRRKRPYYWLSKFMAKKWQHQVSKVSLKVLCTADELLFSLTLTVKNFGLDKDRIWGRGHRSSSRRCWSDLIQFHRAW